MDAIRIEGGATLSGTIPISGAKNAALPLMAAALLTDEPLLLSNLPDLADIKTMSALLEDLGVEISGPSAENNKVSLHAKAITNTTASYDLVRTMRASVLVLGPTLAREGIARVSLPGGCAIGTRPIDLHLMGLEALGAHIELDGGYVVAKAPKGLVGGTVNFPKVSVGATENLLMAASLAKGTSVLENAAREPEIGDLIHCLNGMGAKITGTGTDRLVIEGVDKLHGADEHVIPDRIETGTYLMAAAATGGNITLKGARADHLTAVIKLMRKTGAVITQQGDDLHVTSDGQLRGTDVETQPYPHFPTDLQAQLMGCLCTATGASMITESIFENRFMHVPELVRMGANITVHGASALVRGVDKLIGAPVMATDLRASASLVIAALIAEGSTTINRVYHLDRGYEQLEQKLCAVGAKVQRVEGA